VRKLLILGAGQYGMVAQEIAKAMGIFQKISFLDDNSSKAIGKISDFEEFADEYSEAIVAIGNAEKRMELLEKLESSGYIVSVLIHPQAYVSPSAVIGKGSFIEPMTVIHTDV
jgi:acetyltransferase-like isoleucine patch superfamily enzyme